MTRSSTVHNFNYLMLLGFSLLYTLCVGSRVCENFTIKPNIPGLHKYLDDAYLQQFDEILVIGDVHGCYDELLMLLNETGVNDDNTLKVFTGDLVNKGPKNAEVLNLLRTSKSMISVRGNRDEDTLEKFYMSQNPFYKFENDDEEWIRHLSAENVKYLSQLPYTITLLPLNIIIVHAGIVPDTRKENNSPFYLMNIRSMVYDEERQCIYPTTEDAGGESWSTYWKGPDHVIFGHDAPRMLQLREYATGIDTACVYGYFLTGYFIKGRRTSSMYSVKALKKYVNFRNGPVVQE